jgi:alpha-soluble NSF attachment protein
MNAENQAKIMVVAAEKKLYPGCWEAMCTNKFERFHQAKDLYEKAANNYRLNQKWFEAGECFEKCAQIDEANKDDPSGYYEEASHCFKFCEKKSILKK